MSGPLQFPVLGVAATARLIRADADKVVLETSFASPPGSTVRLDVLAREVGVKVRSCRRDEAGLFRIEGRWVGLSREQRELVLSAKAEPREGPSAAGSSRQSRQQSHAAPPNEAKETAPPGATTPTPDAKP